MPQLNISFQQSFDVHYILLNTSIFSRKYLPVLASNSKHPHHNKGSMKVNAFSEIEDPK